MHAVRVYRGAVPPRSVGYLETFCWFLNPVEARDERIGGRQTAVRTWTRIFWIVGVPHHAPEEGPWRDCDPLDAERLQWFVQLSRLSVGVLGAVVGSIGGDCLCRRSWRVSAMGVHPLDERVVRRSARNCKCVETPAGQKFFCPSHLRILVGNAGRALVCLQSVRGEARLEDLRRDCVPFAMFHDDLARVVPFADTQGVETLVDAIRDLVQCARGTCGQELTHGLWLCVDDNGALVLSQAPLPKNGSSLVSAE